MKTIRFLTLIAIMLLAVLLFRTCGHQCETELNQDEAVTYYLNSRHSISMKQIEDLYNNYKGRFIPVIKEMQENNLDADSVPQKYRDYLPTEYSLVPLKKLKNYLAFVDALQKKNPDQPEITAIAISFGAYNMNKSIDDTSNESVKDDPLRKGDYRGRLTTYLTPAYFDPTVNTGYDSDKHIPFYIVPSNGDVDRFKGTYKSLYCYLNEEYCNLQSTNTAGLFLNLSSINSMLFADDDGQSVSSNEFTDMPPKKPNQ